MRNRLDFYSAGMALIEVLATVLVAGIVITGVLSSFSYLQSRQTGLKFQQQSLTVAQNHQQIALLGLIELGYDENDQPFSYQCTDLQCSCIAAPCPQILCLKNNGINDVCLSGDPKVVVTISVSGYSQVRRIKTLQVDVRKSNMAESTLRSQVVLYQ